MNRFIDMKKHPKKSDIAYSDKHIISQERGHYPTYVEIRYMKDGTVTWIER